MTRLLERSAAPYPRTANDKRAEIFAAWLERAREERGFNQSELAAAAETTPASISRFENAVTPPSRKMAERIGRALATDEMDDDSRARLVADALQAAGFVPDEEIERIPDPDIDYVVHAAEGMSRTNKQKLRDYAELLERANRAEGIGGGEVDS